MDIPFKYFFPKFTTHTTRLSTHASPPWAPVRVKGAEKKTCFPGAPVPLDTRHSSLACRRGSCYRSSEATPELSRRAERLRLALFLLLERETSRRAFHPKEARMQAIGRPKPLALARAYLARLGGILLPGVIGAWLNRAVIRRRFLTERRLYVVDRRVRSLPHRGTTPFAPPPSSFP